MLNLTAKIRKEFGRKTKKIKEKGLIPAVLYGPTIKEVLPLMVDYKDFERVYKQSGESSLIKLKIENQGSELGKEFLVLIHDIQRDPLTEKIIHIDFYQPRLEEEVEATVPIVFEGVSRAVKELGGTLVKNISELEVKALPQKLPKEIKVNIEKLNTFEDRILIKDLILPEGVKVLREPEEIIATVSPPEKVQEELEKPIEEKVEEVEKVEKKKEETESAES